MAKSWIIYTGIGNSVVPVIDNMYYATEDDAHYRTNKLMVD